MKKSNIKNDNIKYMIQYIEPTLVKEKDSTYRYVEDAKQVVDLMQDLQDSTKEKFIAIMLTSRRRILCIEIVHIGSTTESIVSTQSAVRTALLVNAKAIIYVHNHPSGESSPSVEDKNITIRLKHACDLLEIIMMDHIIIGDNNYFSFTEHGLL